MMIELIVSYILMNILKRLKVKTYYIIMLIDRYPNNYPT